jgi:hypothetical protein
MKKALLILSLMVFILAGCAKVVVVKVDKVDGDQQLEQAGMFYALPNTVVRTGVKINKIERIKAPYVRFAAIFAPDEQPVCTNNSISEIIAEKKCKDVKSKKENPDCEKLRKCKDVQSTDENPYCEKLKEDKCEIRYELQKGATFATYGEPDPSNIYMVKFAGGGMIDQTLGMTWNETGILSSVNASVTNRTIDVATTTLSAVTGLAIKAALGGGRSHESMKNCSNVSEKSNSDKWIINIITNDGKSNQLHHLALNYCDIPKSERDKFYKKTDKQLLQAAVAAYKRYLFDLVNRREEVVLNTGAILAPADLIAKLDSMIKERTAKLYIGSKKIETWEGNLDVRKLTESNGKDDLIPVMIPVIRIDKSKGVCFGDDVETAPDSKPYAFRILEGDDCKNAKTIGMKLKYFPEKDRQLFERVRNSTKEIEGEQGFRYRIPAQVSATLKEKDSNKTSDIYGAAVFSVAQLGVTVALPAERNSKTMAYELGFIEATGGLKSFKLGSTGIIDSSTISSLAGSASTAMDAWQNRDVRELTRQYNLLDLKDKICTLKKKYGQSCTD